MNYRQSKILQAVSLLLFVPLASGNGDNDPSLDSDVSQWLKSICKDKRDIRLFSKEQVRLLAEETTRNPLPTGCKENVVNSIIALDETFSFGQSQLCSQEVADSMTKYYNNYVINAKNKAPAAIRSIFAAFGLRLSQVCHERMVKLIKEVQQKTIFTAKDDEVMEQWMGKKSPLAYMLSEPKDYDNLVVPKTLSKEMCEVPHKRLAMKYKTVDTIRELQLRCARRFKPIYEPLIMPLVTLSSIGLNYKGPKAAVSTNSDLSDLIFKWYRVFVVCETLDSFAIDVANSARSKENDKLGGQMEMMIIAPRNDFTGAKIYQELMSNDNLGIEPVNFKPAESEKDIKASATRLSVPIVIANDEAMEKAMEKFQKKASKARKGCEFANKLVKKLQSRATRLLYGKAGGSDVQMMIEYLEKGSFKVKQNCLRRVAIGISGAALASVFIFGAVLATKIGIDAVHHVADGVEGIKDIGDQIGQLAGAAHDATHALDNIGSSINGLQDTMGSISHAVG